MQFTEALCYAVLTITLATTLIHAESESNDVEENWKMAERKMDRRLTRRTTLLVDGAPIQRMFQKPNKVIYRRLTKKRRVSPKPSYGPPRFKYGPPPRNLSKPGSKHRSKHSPKPTYKKRAPKPKYGPPKYSAKTIYGPPKINRYQHHSNFQSESTGFGEPPMSYINEHRPPKSSDYLQQTFNGDSNDFTSRPVFDDHKLSSPNSKYFPNKPFQDNFPSKPHFGDIPNHMQGYGEPPVDSYGTPIKSNLHDLTFSTIKTMDSSNPIDEDYNVEPDSVPWKNFVHLNSDNNVAFSKKRPTLSKLEDEVLDVYVTPVPEDNKELSLTSYSDIFNYRQTKNKKKVPSYRESIKFLNRPWKGAKIKDSSNEEIIVGGQYAEPPGRYVSELDPSGSSGDQSVFHAPVGLSNPDALSSASISSYVNYKNSNMAFSPQNLNDVFSIVDK